MRLIKYAIFAASLAVATFMIAYAVADSSGNGICDTNAVYSDAPGETADIARAPQNGRFDTNCESRKDTADDTAADTSDDVIALSTERPFDYCKNFNCVYNASSEQLDIDFAFEGGIPQSDDNMVYLFDKATYEGETLSANRSPIATCEKKMKVTFSVPYRDRLLFTTFIPAILYEGEYVALAKGCCISNPEALASNTEEYPQLESKKGLLLDAATLDSEKLTDLNVKRVVYNIPLSFIMGESTNPELPTTEFVYNGKTYQFDTYRLGGFDSLFSYLTKNGYHTTAIILNDWNEDHQEIIHPLSRPRTGRSLYYAFNTEEPKGVRLMEATALFLARRYSGGEYGMVYDWVIANEINQHRSWNYMATTDVEYYAHSFERSFRTFYNAIKSEYANAHVYFSIDHDWNDNYGNNARFFNGRELMYAFNDAAKERGNYDWGVSIHPYPAPLTRVAFWEGRFDKSEEAGVITPMNLSVLTDMMQKSDFLDTEGNVRDIAVTELGFSSKPGQKLQAAAVAYTYYIIEDNEYIDSFLLNRQTDDSESLKSGLALGIYNNDYSPKYLADVFANMDTQKGEEYVPEMLDFIGAGSMEEALKRAR